VTHDCHEVRSAQAYWSIVTASAVCLACGGDPTYQPEAEEASTGDSTGAVPDLPPAAEPIPIEPEARAEDYFVAGYDESRTRFLETAEALQTHYSGVTFESFEVPSDSDADLTIDTVFIPAQVEPKKLLVLSSGVHGVEAFIGSAVQHQFVAEFLPDLDMTSMSVLIVHSVNPWGFRHHRRVSESNVDLNRNFAIERDLFELGNDPYADIDEFLNPTDVVTDETVDDALTEVVSFALGHDRAELQQAILQGQYAYPSGVYYGGMDFEPQQNTMLTMLTELVERHEASFLMDLHSGYGERGRLHLFGAPGLGTPEANDAVFEGFEIDTGENNEDFYEITGDFILFFGEIAEKADKTYLSMTMEYGTLDSQTDIGAAQSLVNVRLENQGHHHGYASDEVRARVQEQFLAGYNPPESEYRETIMATTRDIMPVLVERFAALP